MVSLAVAHLIVGAARVPFAVIGRRIADVAAYRSAGAARFFLGGKHQRGAEAIEWILEHTPENAVVPFRGTGKGSLEFAPALLAPRLLVREDACPPGAVERAGRPVATREAPDGKRVPIVLVGLGADLSIEDR